jgi:hypothetical protein
MVKKADGTPYFASTEEIDRLPRSVVKELNDICVEVSNPPKN